MTMDNVMARYSTLSMNKLEETVAKSMKEDVRLSVARAQSCADRVVNALTRRTKEQQPDPDFELAASSLQGLLSAPQVIKDHWMRFVEAVQESLPKEVAARASAAASARPALMPSGKTEVETLEAFIEELKKRISEKVEVVEQRNREIEDLQVRLAEKAGESDAKSITIESLAQALDKLKAKAIEPITITGPLRGAPPEPTPTPPHRPAAKKKK